jgi:hypothetical protein
VAPADRKAVAAIEGLIGQTIAWSGKAAAAPTGVDSAERKDQGRKRMPPRRGRAKRALSAEAPARSPAAAARLDEPRHQPRFSGRQAEAPSRSSPPPARLDEPHPKPRFGRDQADAGSHLPAFLLRPTTRAKA